MTLFWHGHVELSIFERVELEVRHLAPKTKHHSYVALRCALNSDNPPTYIAIGTQRPAHLLARGAGSKEIEAIPTESRELAEIDFLSTRIANDFPNSLADHARAVDALRASSEREYKDRCEYGTAVHRDA